jgi:hypothetical protein
MPGDRVATRLLDVSALVTPAAALLLADRAGEAGRARARERLQIHARSPSWAARRRARRKLAELDAAGSAAS